MRACGALTEMTPIHFTTLLTQLKWTFYLVEPRINLRTAGLAGVLLGLFIFYLLIPLFRFWLHLHPGFLPGILPV